MKNKNISLIIMLLLTFFSFSQEKKVNGIQTGLYGIWGYNEIKIVDQLVLRTDIGTEFGYINRRTVLTPIISLEPRWYYDFKQRSAKDKNTSNNSANFLSFQLKYHFKEILQGDNLLAQKRVIDNTLKGNITWGIRRSFSKFLNYETGIGAGIQRNFDNNTFEPSINIHLKFGIGTIPSSV